MNDHGGITVEPIDAADPRFAQWHATVAGAYRVDREPGWWSSLEATRTYFARRPEIRVRHRAFVAVNDGAVNDGAVNDGAVLGGAELHLPLDADTELAEVELGVLPGARNRGVGTALLDRVRDLAASEGRTILQAEVFVPDGPVGEGWPGARFARRHGLRHVATEHRFLLDLPMTGLYGLIDRLPATDDRIVSWVGACPDEHLAELARMQTQMNTDVPTGGRTATARSIDEQQVRDRESRMAEQGWTTVRSIALDRGGAGRGYTELLVSEHDLDVVVQDDTLVDRAHRGRGLGVRLKLANLLLLQGHDELLGSRRSVQTYCEQDNAAMRRINARIGFRPVDELRHFEGPVSAGTSQDA